MFAEIYCTKLKPIPCQNTKYHLISPGMGLNERGINLEIFNEDARLGNLSILEDGLEYYGNNLKKVVKLTWSQFDKMLEERNKS